VNSGPACMQDCNKGSQDLGSMRCLAKIEGYVQNHVADSEHSPLPTHSLWIKSKIYLVGKYDINFLICGHRDP
jgi:hypothetical protein